MNEIYFHEDNYCQQELLPLDAMDFCRQQIEDIDASSTEHATPDGTGWTDVFIRSEPRNTLSDLQIPLQTIQLIFQKHLPEIPVVYTGYSSYRELCERTIAFGHDDSCVVYADWNDQSIVQHIWTELFTENPEHLKNALSALKDLGSKYPLLYVDWEWQFASPLDGSERLQDRLKMKMDTISERGKSIRESLNLPND